MDQRTRKYMAKLGRKGGRVRSERMESSRRRELARLAANTRWGKYKLAVTVPAATPEAVLEAERFWTAPWTGTPVQSPVRVSAPPGDSSEAEGW
jgi:hypothetical protein